MCVFLINDHLPPRPFSPWWQRPWIFFAHYQISRVKCSVHHQHWINNCRISGRRHSVESQKARSQCQIHRLKKKNKTSHRHWRQRDWWKSILGAVRRKQKERGAVQDDAILETTLNTDWKLMGPRKWVSLRSKTSASWNNLLKPGSHDLGSDNKWVKGCIYISY